MKKLLVLSLAFVLIISALLLVGCRKEPEKEPAAECPHSYERTVITPSTCIAAGEEKFTCTKCDYCYTTKIEATGHIGGTPVEENRVASCVAEGKYDSVVHCTVCDEELSRETVTVTEKIHDVQNGVCTACGGKESTPGLRYSKNDDGTYTVTRIGTCTETDIVIGIYKNRDVTAIGNYAFHDYESLTSIELPDSLTTIGSSAFYECRSLTSIVIPEGVTAIGDGAFSYCTSLTNIELPDSLTTIGDGAFSYCAPLKSIVIPESVTTIGISVFSGCGSLKSIELPDSLTTIGDYAFSYCTSLTNIELPDSLTTIGREAFSHCTSLTSIVIPEGVTTIDEWAFSHCTSLTIHCEVAEKPSGWNDEWTSYDCPVVWGSTGEQEQ